MAERTAGFQLDAPIGVFDSGMGGLSVLRELRDTLPHERLMYVADSGHVPYGTKSDAEIERRSLEVARFFAGHGVKTIVIACNTATAAAARSLRDRHEIPVIGMEPAVKPAIAATRTGVVGVLATGSTLQSGRFAELVSRYSQEVRVVNRPAPGLVAAVESGEIDGENVYKLVEQHVVPMLTEDADTIVLGSTHFPFLRPLIERVAGAGVTVLDTGSAVARRVNVVLSEHGALSDASAFHLHDRQAQGTSANAAPSIGTPEIGEPAGGAIQCWTSGDPGQKTTVASKLWGESLDFKPLPAEFAL